MRILILSFYYPPLNIIAAQRAAAFEKFLSKEGHIVDVITRFYNKEQLNGESMSVGISDSKSLFSDYIKKANIVYTNYDDNNSKLRLSIKLPRFFRGIFNYFFIDVFHFGWINFVISAFKNELSKNKYDFIISTYGPPIMLYAANLLSKITGIPYIIDFRDAYIDEKDNIINGKEYIVENYKNKYPYIRLKKLVKMNIDGFGYGLFKREKIKDVQFPSWWSINKNCAYNNIYPTLVFYLSRGEYEFYDKEVLFYKRIKCNSNINHLLPFSDSLLKSYLAMVLRKFNLAFISIINVYKGSKNIFLTIVITPNIFYRWFILPSIKDLFNKIRLILIVIIKKYLNFFTIN